MVDLSGSIDEETTPSDIIIAVMGPTGTGKSSFIKSITGDETIQIGSSLNSSTQEFGVYSAVIDGRRVEFVDTPGFEDTRDENSDADILQELAAFLMQTYHDRKLFNAVIYMHRISDPRMGKITKRNLRLFTKLCGETSLQNVVIVTTFWDSVNGVVGATREDELRTTFFKPLLDGGARFVRLDRGVHSARKIISDITKNQPRALQLQQELVRNEPLFRTAAGSDLCEELDKEITKCEQRQFRLLKEIATLRLDGGDPESIAELKEELKAVRVKLDRYKEEKQKMSTPFWLKAMGLGLVFLIGRNVVFRF